MNTQTPWRGIFVIVVTPFDDDLNLDEASLRQEIAYCLDAGVHGLVGPANASEFGTLSDAEKETWIRVVLDACGDRVPFIATTSGLHAHGAASFSRWAQEQGAAGIMAMPPYLLHPDAAGCYTYYQQLSQAVSIPIVIQNFLGPIGTPMSSAQVGRMCRELDTVQYVKEETWPEPRQLSATLQAAGDSCLGVFGGQGGVFLLDEYRRGACGNMPACQIAQQHVRLWELLEADREPEARALFNQVLPLISFERLHGVAVYKEVLQRRGVFRTPHCRMPKYFLDAQDRMELDAILEGVEPALVR